MAKLVFVCWGNICRSPMAERVARGMAAERGLDVDVDSVGLSSEETGNPIDRRAAAVLREAGYATDGHRARRVTVDDLAGADLVVAAEGFHISRLQQLYPRGTYALLNDFNPAMPKGEDLQDPWYGPASGFADTLADIEAAMPGILDALAD
ncbi:MAG: low molecular weight protein-tyrosine-phosphatase [Propionibacteriaceae bacterium]|nr:low molecular weight protein-tyrosine-phosphatase [Propionibacteriaceae bacterium]